MSIGQGAGTPAPVRDGIPLGRIAGVPVYLAYSWFIIAALIVVFFGPLVGRSFPFLGAGAYAVALGYAILLLVSVLIHELAHALTAKAYRWPTAKIVLTLWGGHTQFGQVRSTPGPSLLVALAGPAANFLLAGAGWLLLLAAPLPPVAALLTEILIWANLLVAIFNILPGLPLDGGRIVESAVWKATGSQDRGTVAAGYAGRIIALALAAAVILPPYLRQESPDLQVVLLTAVVSGFLWMGAGASISNARVRLRLPSISAAALMTPAVSVPAASPVAGARELLAGRPGTALVITAPTGQPWAIADQDALAQVPEQLAMSTQIDAVARPLGPGAYVPAAAAGSELVDYLAKLQGSEYAVIDRDGGVVGLLTQAAVLNAISAKPNRPRSS
ncbi:site-2 protease family protein [Arthrobacter sp. zg-Y820]|uniref:site-2 protease family protein n=1 Tax=unclassified Arthrobacter TaxID=235627 RepID=UPI002540F472|nr:MULTISPECIES: site-2 protease family protein [unclassified Arthrobacter]MCC9196682.1 site-2 protease family protein [Arthrobacter sp. zg-Y820]MDK1279544.1 site-2 protease family protein [Arthrobacter sp. zg.Y820]WIB08080.1 site-2 protease family protein [Arthrobacter sp. zg-Y820]